MPGISRGLIVAALSILCPAAEHAYDAKLPSWPALTFASQDGIVSEACVETASSSLSLLQVGPPEIIRRKPIAKDGLGRVALPLATEPAMVQKSHASLDDAVPPDQVTSKLPSRALAAVLAVVTMLGAAVIYTYACTIRHKSSTDKQLTNDKLLPPVTASPKGSAPTTSQQQPATAGAASAGSTCCCGDGIGALLRQKPPSQREEKQKPSTRFATPRTAGSLQPAAGDCHPNFSGTWQCVKADGELDAMFADIGIGVIARTAVQAFGYGAGRDIRIYEQEGSHVRMTEKALEETVQEWDITGEEQVVATPDPFLQTSYWDEKNPEVLVLEAKDERKRAPKTWTTTRQYFLDGMENEFVLETTSSGGNVARWTYQRISQ